MNPVSIGHNAKAAFRLLGTSGTTGSDPTSGYPVVLGTPVPQDLGAYDLLPLVDESFDEGLGWLMESTLDGSAGHSQSDLISRLGKGGLNLNGMFVAGLNQVIAACLGFEKVRTTTVLESPSIVNPDSTGLTVQSAAASNLQIATSPWTTDQFKNAWVRIERTAASPNNKIEVRRITTNSANILTIAPSWVNAPVSGDPFSVGHAFQHTYECSKNLHIEKVSDLVTLPWDATAWFVRYGVLGVNHKGLITLEWQAAMVKSLIFKLTAKEGLKVTAEIVPFDLDKRTSSRNFDASAWSYNAHNGLTLGAAGATPLKISRVLFHHCVFRLGAYSTSVPLGNSNKLGLSELEIKIDNPYDEDTQTLESGRNRIQPTRSDKRKVTGSLSLARYADNTRLLNASAEDLLMADLVCTGPAIYGTADLAKLSIFLRQLKLDKPSVNIAGTGPTPEKHGFHCLQPVGISNGMPTPTSGADNSEIIIQTVDANPFNYFMGQHTTT